MLVFVSYPMYNSRTKQIKINTLTKHSINKEHFIPVFFYFKTVACTVKYFLYNNNNNNNNNNDLFLADKVGKGYPYF